MQDINSPMANQEGESKAEEVMGAYDSNKLPVDLPATKKRNSKLPIILVIIGLLLVAIVLVVFVLNKSNSNTYLIDEAQKTIDQLINETDNIEQGLSDLSDNLLDEENVTTDQVDKTLTELDQQIKELDGIENDLTLENSDVGL
jgi:predicted PurR-regulated permease PerM